MMAMLATSLLMAGVVDVLASSHGNSPTSAQVGTPDEALDLGMRGRNEGGSAEGASEHDDGGEIDHLHSFSQGRILGPVTRCRGAACLTHRRNTQPKPQLA